jgi:hypothetical protein
VFSAFFSSVSSSLRGVAKWSQMALVAAVTKNRMWRLVFSYAYWISGLSTMGSIFLGMALTVGGLKTGFRKTGDWNTAFFFQGGFFCIGVS